MRRLLLALAILLVPLHALAQSTPETSNEDRDFLTAFLEDNLSGAGRTVRLTGFAGALSSRATFNELTIADAEGVWITIRNGAISWNRRALLSGRIEIREMTAAEIDLPRRPVAEGATAEASGFSLPELPVAVSIGTLRVDRVVLGEDLFGAAATVSLNGAAELEGGEGSANLEVARIDGREGTIALTGRYANATRRATLDLLVKEAADGIAANLIGLPGKPSVELAIHGSGIIDDFRTDISLNTDGVRRLGGVVTLIGETDDAGNMARSFAARLGGDVAPLLLPEYQDFFGTDVRLEAEGRRAPSGQLDLKRLVVGARGIDLTGSLSLAPGGLPRRVSLTARMGLPDGSDLLLPIPGDKTFVRAGDLTFRFDAARGDGWKIGGVLGGFHRPDIAISELRLDGSGRIARPGQGGVSAARVGGTIRFDATGLAPVDPAIAEAIGPTLSGRTTFHWQEGAPLRLPVFDVTGQGYSASGGISLSGPDDGMTISGRVDANIADMARFSTLAGRPLGGAASLELSGSAGILSGIVDAEGKIEGRNLSAGLAELDRLLAGTAQVTASVRRDTEGTEIRRLDLSAATLSASASGHLKTGASDLNAVLDFTDLSALGPNYRGALSATARLVETDGARRITLDGSGAGLGVGEPTADRILGGRSELSLVANEFGGRVRIETFRLANPQVSVTANGVIDADTRHIDLVARLNDMALLTPGFPGPLTAEGTITETPETYLLDLDVTGPGSTSAAIDGRLALDFANADIAISGGAQSAIVNPFLAPRNIEGPVSFDLRLSGPPRLSSLSGRVAIADGRLVAPTFGIDFQRLNIAADLSGGSATLNGAADVRGGGRVTVSGPVALTPPFDGNIGIRLDAVRLQDPDLYETIASGNVTIRGAFGGGATIAGDIALERTEIRVAATGLGNQAALSDITHIAEPSAVHRTRIAAGLIQDDGNRKNRGPAYGLDVTISAPGRIFVRGRGLDAELAGTLRVGGTTDNIVPAGQFNLLRGRLDILTKRFTIDEGLVQLQGALTPYIRFSASTRSDGITATILIEGDASAPEIRFLSSPELPEEEVVAHLLFGRSLTSLSPFQAAQLASAVATLAGKGGEGLVSRLRSSFGLDDLDVTADEEGAAALRAGKYLSEKVYTDITIGSDGKSELNLNLDVRPGVKVKGSLQSDGGTGIGIFYEKDY